MSVIHSSADIGQAVRRTRRAQGLTQAELAGACGTGTRFIVELEQGKPTCRIERVLHVLSVLGITVSLDGDAPADGRGEGEE